MNSGWTLKSEMRKTRTLNLSISGGQIVESYMDQFTLGTSYKISDFHPWGFMTGSKIKNDLSLSGDVSYKNQYALLRKIVGKYAQASSGNKLFEVNLMADYTISSNMSLAFFYDLQSTVPLVSSYPVTSSDIGFSVKFSLNR
jgi:cell surface protein SprA